MGTNLGNIDRISSRRLSRNDEAIISYSANFDIPIIDPSQISYKVSGYDKVSDYCKRGYLICEDSGGKHLLAINNIELISNVNDAGYSVNLINDRDFYSLLKGTFSRYNASKAKYHLDFISPLSAAKNIKHSRQVFILLFCMVCVFTQATFAYHFINNIIYLAQNVFKSLLFISATTFTSKNIINHPSSIQNTLSDDEEYPIYTILLPIYREARVAHLLIQSIGKLAYPKSRLDVKIIIEEDDVLTLKAIKAIVLPDHMHIIIVPYSLPRTKPKALNYAMQYAKGKYVVIYDAEDIPDVTNGYKMTQSNGIKVIQQEVVYSLSKREVETNASIGADDGNKDFGSARQEFEADSF